MTGGPILIVGASLALFAGWYAAVPAQAATADELRAQLAKERVAHRHQLVKVVRANRRLRHRPPSPFTTADTRLAARLVAVVGGWPEQGALRVAWCESHHQPAAQNRTELGGSHASGAWQVLWPGTWRSTDVGRAFPNEAAAFNPYLNAFAALRVYQRQHNTFREWNDVCARQG